MKTKKKSVLSISTQMDYIYLSSGIGWTLTGVFALFDSMIFDTLQIIALLCSIFFTHKATFSEKEINDEMSIKNLAFAKASTIDFMRLIISCILLIVTVLLMFPIVPKITINISSLIVPMCFIYLGIENTLIGIFFRRNERNEEECTF